MNNTRKKLEGSKISYSPTKSLTSYKLPVYFLGRIKNIQKDNNRLSSQKSVRHRANPT